MLPGRSFSDGILAVLRSAGKSRNATRRDVRSSKFVFDVFRRDFSALMPGARKRLRAVKEPKAFYTGKDIKGIGKNDMNDSLRKCLCRPSFPPLPATLPVTILYLKPWGCFSGE
jgi:hypothetical protein